MLEPDDIAAWVRLALVPGVSRGSARRLLAAFGSPAAVVDAGLAALAAVVPADVAKTLTEPPPPELQALIDATQAWCASGDGRALVTLGDPDYPAALLETADPPLLLHAQGRLELLNARSIAIVGSRNPTAQGTENARAFAAAFSRAGWTVVSGLALGIDGAAHEGALQGAGSTVAIVGTGLDRVYPARHHALAQRIARDGVLLSEYPLGMPPLPDNFPRRNRLIAGMSRGTLVVEAALASGSLITARLAVEAGREVFAIPGSIHAAQSRGCHALIKQGAKLVETADDVFGELAPQQPPSAPVGASADAGEDDVLAALGHDPATIDALTARCGWTAQRLQVRLLELELDGRVARLPGGLFQRIGQA